ncbi:ATP-grasp domain-containing protein [Streptomyces sp. SL13]|uniref:ATP-grasp domain-containing protein n=1 Tax=Streptantibioticus silvisoli TaxID=2705255 RepID=A0AA90KBK5_9ACTN|nr:ATP-grasp domain-containing protein [Streptantibioticus silvisoli]MDI5966536.1 ATP-grasp domain-containing protein [Streptantibioticus silvisoli]MDI5973798.1 ATP-grasp domain-containing protein [Streptantibioticus silvisoli]
MTTTPSPRIAVIGGTVATLRKARAAGFDVVWIHGPHELDRAGLEFVAEAHLTDYREPRAVADLLTAVHRISPLVRVVSMIEDGLESAAAATSALGLPGNGLDVVRVLQDKLAFRTLLEERGVEGVTARLGHTEQDIRAFVTEFGPAVIKPRYGSGSIGVRMVPGLAAVTEVAAWAREFGLHTFLMERYLRGAELSVETFTFGGRHTVIAHTAKEILDSFVEIGHVQPAGLDPAVAAEVDALVVRMLDAVGFQDGPAHTEVIVTDDGPRLVESHNRRGGDRIADLVNVVHGVDTDALAFLWYAGRTAPVTPGPPRGGGAIRFLTAEPGIVESVEGAEQVRADPHVVDLQIGVAPGDTVSPIAWSYDRSGLLLVRGTDAQDARRRAVDLVSRITIRTRPDENGPRVRTIAAVAPRPDRLLGAAPEPTL